MKRKTLPARNARTEKPESTVAVLDEKSLVRVTGGTDALRNVKNFDKPTRDYMA